LPFRGGVMLEGFLFLTPHAPSMVYYGSFFALRLLLHPVRDVLKAFTRFAPACTVLAAILFPLSLWLSHLDLMRSATSPRTTTVGGGRAGFLHLALIYAFAGWTLRLFDFESPWILTSRNRRTGYIFSTFLSSCCSRGCSCRSICPRS
jgi:hypothetical protein